MALDDILKKNMDWLEQALKRPMFDKVDEKILRISDEQRERRMGELKSRIDALARRKDEAVAAYDRAIAAEQAELDALARQPQPLDRRAPA